MRCKPDTIAQTLTWTFEGELPAITLNIADMSVENRTYAVIHGMKQRITDNAAIARKNPKTGEIINVTEAMRHAAIAEMRDHYASGTSEWNLRASVAKSINPTIAAIATKRGCTYEEAEAFLAAQFLGELTEQ